MFCQHFVCIDLVCVRLCDAKVYRDYDALSGSQTVYNNYINIVPKMI